MADRLGGVFQQRIGGVDIQIVRVGHIGGDAAAGEPADIGQRVLKAGEIVQIAQGRGAVEPGIQIQRLYRRAAGAEMHGIAADLDGSVRIAAMKGE